MAQLTAEMLRVVDETVQPEFAGLWLREAPNITNNPGRPLRNRQ